MLYGKAVGALQGALCSCMERFVESGYGSGRSGVVRFGKVSRGLVGRVLVWQLWCVWASYGLVGFVKVWYGSHGTERLGRTGRGRSTLVPSWWGKSGLWRGR